MWHRVAALLGRTVAELQATMSSAEFSQWCAFYQLEPWGYEMENWRMGVLATTAAQVAGAKRVKPSDFYPRRGGGQQSPAEMRKVIESMADKGGTNG